MTVQRFASNIAQFLLGKQKNGMGGAWRGNEADGEAKLAAGLLFLVGFLFLFSRHLPYRQDLGKLELHSGKIGQSSPSSAPLGVARKADILGLPKGAKRCFRLSCLASEALGLLHASGVERVRFFV